MRIWAKRGIQAALVTGGMIALGTGVANAGGCDATCPPQPHVPVDGSAPAGLLSGPGVDVPIHAANNKIGTPLGEIAWQGRASDRRIAAAARGRACRAAAVHAHVGPSRRWRRPSRQAPARPLKTLGNAHQLLPGNQTYITPQ